MKLNIYTATLTILTLLLSACGSAPKFQKTGDETGYKIEELELKNSFRVIVPEYSISQYKVKYAFRAAGEECLARGFEYFDFSDRGLDFYGFCYPTGISKSLAITFISSELDKNPPQFIVESLNNKPLTNLKAGDEILAINEQPSQAMWKIKYSVFLANNERKQDIKLRIRRGSDELTVAEPLVNFSGYLYGKENLEALRKSVK